MCYCETSVCAWGWGFLIKTERITWGGESRLENNTSNPPRLSSAGGDFFFLNFFFSILSTGTCKVQSKRHDRDQVPGLVEILQMVQLFILRVIIILMTVIINREGQPIIISQCRIDLFFIF